MNDKCAAGTGRFLESLARVLELDVRDLGALSLESDAPAAINSTCVVFAESEVISLAAMARKARVEQEVMLTGGGGLNVGIVKVLEEELMVDIFVFGHPQFNGAIGAALIARAEARIAANVDKWKK